MLPAAEPRPRRGGSRSPRFSGNAAAPTVAPPGHDDLAALEERGRVVEARRGERARRGPGRVHERRLAARVGPELDPRPAHGERGLDAPAGARVRRGSRHREPRRAAVIPHDDGGAFERGIAALHVPRRDLVRARRDALVEPQPLLVPARPDRPVRRAARALVRDRAGRDRAVAGRAHLARLHGEAVRQLEPDGVRPAPGSVTSRPPRRAARKPSPVATNASPSSSTAAALVGNRARRCRRQPAAPQGRRRRARRRRSRDSRAPRTRAKRGERSTKNDAERERGA